MSEVETLYPLSIYDALGKIRRDLDPSEIAKCSKGQQTILFPVLSSLEAAEKSETMHYECVKAVRRGVTALDHARKAYEKALPTRTFHMEWLETVAKQKPKPPSKETVKAIADALSTVEKAEASLAECLRAVRFILLPTLAE
jgi:hypothetical protein